MDVIGNSMPIIHADDVGFKSLAKLYDAVEASVVEIRSDRGQGSGFVIDRSGLIATCYHCIANSSIAAVILPNGQQLEFRRIVKAAPERDIAIIAVDPCDSVVPLSLDTRKPKSNEHVAIIGSPLNPKSYVPGQCVVRACTGYDLPDYRGEMREMWLKVALVEVSGPLIHGNSGSPIVDEEGRVIAMCAFILEGHSSQSYYGIAASEIKDLLDSH
jgi:S1-C subfamily serine protease